MVIRCQLTSPEKLQSAQFCLDSDPYSHNPYRNAFRNIRNPNMRPHQTDIVPAQKEARKEGCLAQTILSKDTNLKAQTGTVQIRGNTW
jgi:hypothetical protein